MWITVLKWVGLGFAILALVGLPALWHSKKVDEAYALGKTVAEAACATARAEALAKWAANSEKIIMEEAEKAQRLESELAVLAKKAENAQRKLTEALSKTPLPVGCVVNSNATDILRHNAAGDFNPSNGALLGDGLEEVPGGIAIPRKGEPESAGVSNNLR